MVNKKLSLAKIILLSGIILTIIVDLFICAAKKPVITEYSFPFSITYEFGGETVRIEDEFVCVYTGPGQSVDPADRFYDGYLKGGDDELACGDYLIERYEDGELVILTEFFAGYMMGDPLYKDHYTDYYRFEPQIGFYVYDEYIEYTDEEALAPYDVRIVDWEYPQPVENKLSFAGFTRLTRNTVLPMLAVSLLTLLACIILVKKEEGLSFGVVDKVSVLFNFVLGFAALPFLAVCCTLIDINGSADDPLSMAAFFVPALCGFGLAASVCLRRKGYGKLSLLVQFAGVALMALVLLAEQLFGLM